MINALCNFLQRNEFQVVIVEGPRGVGKSTFCGRLLSQSDLVFYKTWGLEQRDIYREMRTLSLDLPQGTYFVLDFIKQIDLAHPILADRGNLSALAYQKDQPYGTNSLLHQYYVKLMHECHAVLLVLMGPEDVILNRRLRRRVGDEQKVYLMPPGLAVHTVQRDVEDYSNAVETMVRAGLHSVASFGMDEGCVCTAYVPRDTVVHYPEGTRED